MKIPLECKSLFTVMIIGEALRDLYLWKRPGLTTYFLDTPSQLAVRHIDPMEIDMIFLATPVIWLSEEGAYDTYPIQRDLDILRSDGFYHSNIVLSSILPIGVADRMGCHYCPLLPLIPERRVVGYHLSLLMDMTLFRSLFTALLDRYDLKITKDAEMVCLIDTCQTWINTSFQSEISLFCSKISRDFSRNPSSSYLRKELYPILVYMIRQIEDYKLDCPLLYSCLFRHNYIDIPV